MESAEKARTAASGAYRAIRNREVYMQRCQTLLIADIVPLTARSNLQLCKFDKSAPRGTIAS